MESIITCTLAETSDIKASIVANPISPLSQKVVTATPELSVIIFFRIEPISALKVTVSPVMAKLSSSFTSTDIVEKVILLSA